MSAHTEAWWCPECWERMELAPNGNKRARRRCPECEAAPKMHRVSRYEWFLEDAVRAGLQATKRSYRIRPQYPVRDHRGFDWYWDLGIWVQGSSFHKGGGLLIDVNGPDHLVQKRYSGPGGGYTRDYDKTWELGSQQWHKRGWDHWIVKNEDCKRSGNIVWATANEIVTHLLYMADNWC